MPVYPRADSLDRDRASLDRLVALPLWSSLPAVAADRLYTFDGELVYTSPRTAEVLLGDLLTLLSQARP